MRAVGVVLQEPQPRASEEAARKKPNAASSAEASHCGLQFAANGSERLERGSMSCARFPDRLVKCSTAQRQAVKSDVEMGSVRIFQ